MACAAHRYLSSRTIADIFASWCLTAERLRLTPPDLRLELMEGPATAALGARFHWKVRRWGLTQRWVNEIIEFDVPRQIVEVQMQGPFPRWRHTIRFEKAVEGTSIVDEIEFEPPSGLLGRWLTEESVMRELDRAWSYRDSVW